MIPGLKINIHYVSYTVETVGPRTTLLLRADGVYVHADTSALNALLDSRKKGGAACL